MKGARRLTDGDRAIALLKRTEGKRLTYREVTEDEAA